jgi:hypothetical protein
MLIQERKRRGVTKNTAIISAWKRNEEARIYGGKGGRECKSLPLSHVWMLGGV